jgi:hypothetical protein
VRRVLQTASKKDALLMAVHVTLHLAEELRKGNQVFVGHPGQHDLQRLVMLGIEKPGFPKWTYLVEQAHPWRRQLFVKGRKLPASSVWAGMQANGLTVEEAADDWDLPVAAVREIIEYCHDNKQLLQMEADEELRLLQEKGIEVAPPATNR